MNDNNMNQQFLDNLQKNNSSFFLDDVQQWCSHRPLLQIALELTKDSQSPILELGTGYGSTEQLHRYIQNDNRKLFSLDTNKEWLTKYSHLNAINHELVFKPDNIKWNPQAGYTRENCPAANRDWYDSTNEIPEWLDSVSNNGISVCLVDHACGERRHHDIKRIYEKCDIMVIHDTQPEATGYLLERIWGLFKYRLNLLMEEDAAIVSNKYDVTKLSGLKFGRFTLK